MRKVRKAELKWNLTWLKTGISNQIILTLFNLQRITDLKQNYNELLNHSLNHMLRLRNQKISLVKMRE